MVSILVSTEWLSLQLKNPDLRVLDATAFLDPKPDGKPGYLPRSGKPEWEKGHIPTSHHVDLIQEVSDTSFPFLFTMPSFEDFSKRIQEKGIGDENLVVIYSSGPMMWATRLWWMFQSIGFKNCKVLDGGFAKWKKENREVTTEMVEWPSSVLTCEPTPSVWANKSEIVQTLRQHQSVCLIDCLSPKDYFGERAFYGRPGHIPGSRNIFFVSLLDNLSGTYLPLSKLRTQFKESGAFEKDRVICYCGGGIASTLNAFALKLCGHQNVAVYDGSMLEWASDSSLPLITGNDS